MSEKGGFWDRYFTGWEERMIVRGVAALIFISIVGIYILFFAPSPQSEENNIVVIVHNQTNRTWNVTVIIVHKQFGHLYNHTLLNMGSKIITSNQTVKFHGSADAFNSPAEIRVRYDNTTLTKEITIEKSKQVFDFTLK